MSDTEHKTKRFEMRISAGELAKLDRLRKEESDLPQRADMVRRLIERAAEKKVRK